MKLSAELHGSLNGASIMEASLGRIWQHNKDRAFLILTAWRGNLSLDENKANLIALKKKVRQAGLGFIQAEGVGQEESGPASEPSLIIPGRGDPADADGELLKLGIAWGKAYDQYAIFYHVVRKGKSVSAVVNVASGATDLELDSFKPSEIGGFYTKLRSKGTFKYEWIGVKFADPPNGWVHGVGRQAQGEIGFELAETRASWLAKVGGQCVQ